MPSSQTEQQNDVTTGNVKWFNNKSGFGFITALNNDMKGQDIFVHHTSIDVNGDLYKYLVQGEYVEFDVQKMDSKDHEHQAINITGIKNGDLMCETRFKNKDLSRVRDGFSGGSRKHTGDHVRRRSVNATE